MLYVSFNSLSNQGSKTIQGIRLISPNPTTVQLHAEAFKKMENLKYLIVHNVLISEELKYLPNVLKLLEWPKYHFSLPSNFPAKQLVKLEILYGDNKLVKLFKQV